MGTRTCAIVIVELGLDSSLRLSYKRQRNLGLDPGLLAASWSEYKPQFSDLRKGR